MTYYYNGFPQSEHDEKLNLISSGTKYDKYPHHVYLEDIKKE